MCCWVEYNQTHTHTHHIDQILWKKQNKMVIMKINDDIHVSPILFFYLLKVIDGFPLPILWYDAHTVIMPNMTLSLSTHSTHTHTSTNYYDT